MTHEYPRGMRAPMAQDVTLVVAAIALGRVLEIPAGLRTLLLGSIALVLLWGVGTLHFPAKVAIDAEGVVFERYGRAHRFAWKDVERVRVRRFLVKDRVFVRIEPSGSAWRGRYWLADGLSGFDGVVAELEQRGAACAVMSANRAENVEAAESMGCRSPQEPSRLDVRERTHRPPA